MIRLPWSSRTTRKIVQGDSRCLWCACLVVSRRESHAHSTSRCRRRRGQLLSVVVSSRRFLSLLICNQRESAGILECRIIARTMNGMDVARCAGERLENAMGCYAIARCGVGVLVSMLMTKLAVLGDAQRRDGYTGIQLGPLKDLKENFKERRPS